MNKSIPSKQEIIQKIKRSPPIFVVGCQRSGTSMLFRIIQRYLKIGFGRDNGHFLRLKRNLAYYGDLNEKKNIHNILNDIITIPEFKKRFRGLDINNDEFINNLETHTYSEIVRQFYAEWAYFNGNIRWGGKTPDYTFHLLDLQALFPDLRIVHIYRDGRDVALSLFNLNWGPKNTYMAAKYWDKRVQSVRNLQESLNNENFFQISYEDLLQNPVLIFDEFLNFIAYEGKEQVMENFRNTIFDFVRPDNIFKWKKKMSEHQIETFERVAGNLLHELNYEICNPGIINKRYNIAQKMYFLADNAVKKILRGEGFKGLALKFRLFFHDLRLKIKYIFQK